MTRCPAHGNRIQRPPSRAVNLFGATPQPDCRRTRFLEEQLASLDHYLPETYDYLMQELDIQRRLLAELEIKDAFTLIDTHQDSSLKTTGSL